MKRTQVDSLAKSFDNADMKMLNMAVAKQDYKLQSLSVKHQKYLTEQSVVSSTAKECKMATQERMLKEEHVRARE